MDLNSLRLRIFHDVQVSPAAFGSLAACLDAWSNRVLATETPEGLIAGSVLRRSLELRREGTLSDEGLIAVRDALLAHAVFPEEIRDIEARLTLEEAGPVRGDQTEASPDRDPLSDSPDRGLASRLQGKQSSRPPAASESDPNGIDAHSPGAKLDAGKNRCGLVINGFSRALWQVARVGTFGAAKYTPNGWVEVENGVERYTDAMHRHLLDEAQGQDFDSDSTLLHAAHAAWNALARLELMLRERADD
jgi:hypothetical protein